MQNRVLICDDDSELSNLLAESLVGKGYCVQTVNSGEECIVQVRREIPDVILLDMKLPGIGGIATLEEIRKIDDSVPVIIMTGFGSISSAISASQLGITRYLEKPFPCEEMAFQIAQAIFNNSNVGRLEHYREQQATRCEKPLGESPTFKAILETIICLARAKVSAISLLGETGVGKKHLARHIHQLSAQKGSPIVEINCGSIAPAELEEELFGKISNDNRRRKGLLEIARSGTVFLEDIESLSLATQAKLFQTLDKKQFSPIGGNTRLELGANVIVSSTKDLLERVSLDLFRRDLFYLLMAFPIRVPPLRQRSSDIPILIAYFLDYFLKSSDRSEISIDEAALALLTNYAWQGNIRELRNVLERILILNPNLKVINERHLPSEIRFKTSVLQSSVATQDFALPQNGVNLESLENSLLMQALQRSKGNQSTAAKALGISRHALRYRLQKMNAEEQTRVSP